MTKERAINLRPHEVRGLLDGTITQLRRVMKPQPWECDNRDYHGAPCGDLVNRGADGFWHDGRCIHSEDIEDCSPFGRVGGVLYGRECWGESATWEHSAVSLYAASQCLSSILEKLATTSGGKRLDNLFVYIDQSQSP